MDKRGKGIFAVTFLLLLVMVSCAAYSLTLHLELLQKNSRIDELNRLNIELKNQLDAPQKPYLVTSLGVSVEPRNVTYPHPHFTFEGVIFNVGYRTAYNARLEIAAYYKNGLSAFNLSIPLGNLEKWQVIQVSRIISTSDWIGNYTITPVWDDFS
ncbi:MAG: hypothetical protein NWF09_04140 [Candidatus Bathyarchaeota archaeon]|nr:hypothetical protein [Candidatus Bathyarchaeota archaeon]